jgi:cyclophilin family peptidyl-prolyl cis-trans isomerase
MKKLQFIIFFLWIYNTAFSQNKFSNDSVLVNIYNHAYNREGRALIPYLNYENPEHRYAACMGFASITDTAFKEVLIIKFKRDTSEKVRRAAAIAMGQMKLPSLIPNLSNFYIYERKISIQKALIEAIGKCGGKEARDILNNRIPGQYYEDFNKAYVRALFYCHRRETMPPQTILNLKKMNRESNDDEVKALSGFLLQSQELLNDKSLKTNGKIENNPSISLDQLQKSVQTISNPYQRIEQIKTLNPEPEVLLSYSQSDSALVVKTYCIETYLNQTPKVEATLLSMLLVSENVAYISLACNKIMEDTTWKVQKNEFLPLLRLVAGNMQLPRDFEAWQDLYRCMAFFEGETFETMNYFRSGYRNDLKWDSIVKIPENQKVRIKTNKGDVILTCLVNEAPGSVCHFLELVQSGYYNGKYFHRMVPNFVVQGGCPRGDGWGSLDWIQRSEFSNELSYAPGSVGLASAGKDSEGVQFFITHTYTAQLNGRYSIFATVTEGMDIVNQLKVGDQILSIELIPQ